MTILPLKTVSEMNVRTHWATRAARMKQHRQTAYLMVQESPLPCVVTMTRLSPGTLDDDNLRSALKGVRDGIADRFGLDDADPRIRWRYEQEKVSRGTYGVRVEVSPKTWIDEIADKDPMLALAFALFQGSEPIIVSGIPVESLGRDA